MRHDLTQDPNTIQDRAEVDAVATAEIQAQDRADVDAVATAEIQVSIVPDSWDREARTVEVRFATDALILRKAGHPLGRKAVWREQLVFEPGAVDLARVNAGKAHSLDAHKKTACADVFGSSVPGSARLAEGEVYATIKFRNTQAALEVFESIGDGSFTNWSMRYLSGDHRPVYDAQKRVSHYRAFAWVVLTIDPVPVAADWRAGVTWPGAKTAALRSIDDSKPLGGLMTTTKTQPETQTPAPTSEPQGVNTAERYLQITEMARECAVDRDTALLAVRGDMDLEQARAFFDGLQQLEPTKPTEPTAPTTPEPEPEPKPDPMATEQARCLAITEAVRAADLPLETAETFIADGVTVTQARAAILETKAATSYSPRPSIRSDYDHLKAAERALEDALIIRTGGTVAEPTREAARMADDHVLEGFRAVLDKGGVSSRDMDHSELVRSATSSGTFDVLGTRVLARRIVQIYKETSRPYSPFVDINDQIRDFNPVLVDTVENDVSLKKVGEKQNLNTNTGATLEDTDQYKLDHYSGKVSLSYRSWLNDDIRRFADQMNAAADAAVRTERAMVLDPLLANTARFGAPGKPKNTPLFHANHGNIHSAAAITGQAVRDAEKKMFLQQTMAGRVLETKANYILCSKAAEDHFVRMFAQNTPHNTDDVNVITAANQGPDRLEGWVVLPELDFAEISSITKNTYFLVSRPNALLKTIEIGYLRGNRNIEVFKSGWDDHRNMVWHFDFKVGVKYLSYKGFVRVDMIAQGG